MALTDTLQASAQSIGLDLDEPTAGHLVAYLVAVLEANRRVNLTAPIDAEDAISRHLVDSLAAVLDLRDRNVPSEELSILDLGTGGGFPGVPLAILYPASVVHLVESRGRKIDAVRTICRELSIDNVRIHHGRLVALRETEAELRSVDLLMARAVAPMEKLLREGRGSLAPGGVLCAWKADQIEDEERRRGEREAARGGMEALQDLTYGEEPRRRLVRFRKANVSP